MLDNRIKLCYNEVTIKKGEIKMEFTMTKKELLNLITKQLEQYNDNDIIHYDQDCDDSGAWCIITVNGKEVYKQIDC